MAKIKSAGKTPARGSQFTWDNQVFKYIRKQGAYTVALRDNGCLTSLYLPKNFFSLDKHFKKKRPS